MGCMRFIRRIQNPISKPSNRSFRSTVFSNLYKHSFSSTPVCRSYCFNQSLDAQTAQDSEIICSLVSKSWNSRNLDSALNSANLVHDLSSKLILEVLKKLNNAGIIALSFFRWAENRKGFQHTPECYNALIDSLGKIKQFKMVWLLVDEMKSKGILGMDTFALILRRLIRAKKVKDAVESFKNMDKNHGLKPQLQDYNRLFDALSKSKHVDIAHQVFDVWKNTRFKPDIRTYTALIEGWGRERNFLKVNEVLRYMRDDGIEPDVVTYGILIDAYSKVQKLEDAMALYEEMERNGMKATPHIYSTLIYALQSDRRLGEAVEYFNICKASGCGIDAPTYNVLVGAYCSLERLHNAYELVDEMRACGVGPGTRTYDIILHHLAKARRIEEACGIFESLHEESGCEPGVSTYEIMVRMFCNEGRVDMAMNVWDRMKGRGVVPRMEMFSVLIDCLCHQSEVEEAWGRVLEMMDMGIRPPRRLFRNLKKLLVDARKEDLVVVLAHKMEKLRNTPLVG